MATVNKEASAGLLNIISNFKLKLLNSLRSLTSSFYDLILCECNTFINVDLQEEMNSILFRFFLLPTGTTWKAEESFFGGSLHSSQEEPEAPVLPDKARNSWLIDTDKGSEVRAVKRLLTSHFICQTFISLFMVQCTPSVQAMLHTCAWNTFKAFSPPFSWPHGQTGTQSPSLDR